MTFVLLPGAGGRPWYWHRVEPELRRRGCSATLVELPAADDAAGLPEYADAVVRAIGTRPPTPLVLVAQSLAGFVAPLVCDRVEIARLVLVNAMIPNPGETPGAWWSNVGHAEARRRQRVRDGRPADAPFDPLIDFFHDVPQAVIDEAFAQGEPPQSETVFASPCAFASWPAVPTQVIVAREDRFLPADLQRRVASTRLGITPDEMPGGHLVALSRPVELAERLVGRGTHETRRLRELSRNV
ncbi:MAG TPA: alpha/beta hydrolase [Vicinamibacterales bacterium]|nr:alpha/beta hydrolase [Vicinamibacterales bacterium]